MADDVAGIYSASMPDKDPYKAVNDVSKMQQGLIATERAQTGLDTEKLGLAQRQISTMHGMLSDLLNNPKAGRADMSKDITDRLAYGVKLGLYTPAQSVEAMKTVPTDARGQYQWMTTHLGSLMEAQQKLHAYVGPPTTEGVGSGSVTTQQGAMPTPPGTPPRELRVQRTQEYGLPPTTEQVVPSGPNRGARMPIGNPGVAMPRVPGYPQAPQAQMAPQAPRAVPPAARPAPPPAAAAPPPAVPSPAAPAPAAAAPEAPPDFNSRFSASQGNRIMTQMAPGQAESMQGAAHAYNEASQTAGAYAQRVNPLRQAIPILEKMKNTDTGPLTDRVNEFRSAAQSLGAGPILGIDPEKIKDYNELKKYFTQYSAQVGASLGPKTNDGLATAVTSNPNVHMDRLSALELSKVALGVERMRQAGILLFNDEVQSGKRQPADFNKFMVDWGSHQDPRGFVFDLMDKKGRDAVRKLPSSEQKKIHDAMTIADKYGLLGDVHRGQ